MYNKYTLFFSLPCLKSRPLLYQHTSWTLFIFNYIGIMLFMSPRAATKK